MDTVMDVPGVNRPPQSLKNWERVPGPVIVLSDSGSIVFANSGTGIVLPRSFDLGLNESWLCQIDNHFDNGEEHERALRRITGDDPFRWLTRVVSREVSGGAPRKWMNFLYARCYLQGALQTLVIPTVAEKSDAITVASAEWDLSASVLPVLQGLDRVEVVCGAVAEVAADGTGAQYAAVRIGSGEAASIHAAGPASKEEWTAETLSEALDPDSPLGRYYPRVEVTDGDLGNPAKGQLPLCLIAIPLVADERFLGRLELAVPISDLRLAHCLEAAFVLASSLSVYLRWAPTRTRSARGVSPKTLSIGVLGPLEIRVDGQPVCENDFRRKHSVELLKRLIATGSRSLNKEEVMDAFWPDASPKAAGDSLRAVIHSLRRGLEPQLKAREASRFISGEGERVALDRDQVRVDADEFIDGYRQCTKLERLGHLEEAIHMGLLVLELYRGPFLEEEVYSDWCIAQRSRLHEVFLDLSMRVGAMLMKREDWETAIVVFHRAVVEEPAREDTHRALMIALWRSGRYSSALKQFDRCWNILRDSLGVSPTRETIRVREGIMKSLEERRISQTKEAGNKLVTPVV